AHRWAVIKAQLRWEVHKRHPFTGSIGARDGVHGVRHGVPLWLRGHHIIIETLKFSRVVA
ncbi:MAG: hypothetical protein JXQ27_16795, partial [Acidobacteria bacterium]|nr:hypothetical protein [Acidobacteriota bacterium]